MHVLLLQGPMSPFFQLLANDLEANGILTSKINFNGGDEYFFSDSRAHSYRGTPENWKIFLQSFLVKRKITMMIGYGDCRFYHRVAKNVAKELSIPIYFFEEGYFRPHWLTFERSGVNAHSELWKLRLLPEQVESAEIPSVDLPQHFWNRVVLCSLYYLAAALRRSQYPHYQHHRVLSARREAFWWVRAGFRKWLYKPFDHWKWHKLTSRFPKRYYLVPLQIRDDAQIQYHSPYSCLKGFLEDVISSFSRHAPSDTCLVIKHHPMDRGHTHYGKIIHDLAKTHGVQDRVLYVHDIANPMLLRQALGLVTINSTMGISGLIHGKRVITLGRAMYHIKDLTYFGTLDSFWQSDFQPDPDAYAQFRQVVMKESQIPGSFYYPRFKVKLPDRFYRELAPSRKQKSSRLQGRSSNQNS